MDEMLEKIKKKLPNLSNMDVEMLRSIFTHYCIDLIYDNKKQLAIFESVCKPKGKKVYRSKKNRIVFEATGEYIPLVPQPPRRGRGRPRRNTIPGVPPPVPNHDYSESGAD